MSVTLSDLQQWVINAVAIRGAAILEPAGGPGDKVFPPSHSVAERNKDPGAKYAFETRRIEGSDVRCVLLDSVQSQANRMEEALQALWLEKQIRLPVIAVDFSKFEGLGDLGTSITSLTAPHRIADALLRDSMCEGTLFRHSKLGRSFTDASLRDASALFRACPTGLVFGIWDSTGPKGGLGAKFARALVSEIVGIDAASGAKTSSRIDPTGIVTKAATIFEAKERDPDGHPVWTHQMEEAKPKDAKKLAAKSRDKWEPGDFVTWGKKEKAGKPTAVLHSNIPPSIDELAGGVTIDHARHTVVLSLAGLRKIGFGADVEGGRKARVALAALGLVAVFGAQERGHDLRSRCLLVPRKGEALKLEVVQGDGSTEAIAMTLREALSLYSEAVNALPTNLAFGQELGQAAAILTPSEKLAHLIRESRRLAAAGEEDEGG